MRSGTVAAISKTDHPVAQSWSKHFYEGRAYQAPEGLRYFNAHNDGVAFALYERAEDVLDIIEERRLDDPDLRNQLAFAARSKI